MFQNFKIAFTLCLVMLFTTKCTNFAPASSEKELENTRMVAAIQTLNVASLLNSQFILNGTWNSFTGNGTTLDTIVTISARSGENGLLLTDSSAFGGYSSCSIVAQFDNTAGYFITQNPENNGGCFANDTNKGLYFKTVFFAEGSKYWTCTIFNPVATVALAIAVTDNTTRTDPANSGCGGFSWSRLERR